MPDVKTRGLKTRSARGIAVVAVLMIVAVIVARSNPWRYVHLMPAADTGVFLAVMTAAVVLLGVAAQVAARPRRVASAVTAWLVAAMFVLCAWPVFDAVHDTGYDRGAAAVVAVSPDGRFEVVAVRYRARGSTFHVDRYQLRSRAGAFSRQADRALADIYQSGERRAVAAVNFSGPHEVELRTADNSRWTVTFDPRTLSLPHTLTWNETTGYEWTRRR